MKLRLKEIKKLSGGERARIELAIDDKAAEVKATNEIKRDKNKYKLDEVDPNIQDGPLF